MSKRKPIVPCETQRRVVLALLAPIMAQSLELVCDTKAKARLIARWNRAVTRLGL